MPVCIMVTILKSGLHLTGVFCVIGLEFLAPSPAVPGRPPPRKPTLRRGRLVRPWSWKEEGREGEGKAASDPVPTGRDLKSSKRVGEEEPPQKALTSWLPQEDGCGGGHPTALSHLLGMWVLWPFQHSHQFPGHETQTTRCSGFEITE